MAFSPLFIIPDFFLHFSNELCYGYLGSEGISHFFQTMAEFFWKMQRKTWYSIFGVDAMPLSLKNLFLSLILGVLLEKKIRITFGFIEFKASFETFVTGGSDI